MKGRWGLGLELGIFEGDVLVYWRGWGVSLYRLSCYLEKRKSG